MNIVEDDGRIGPVSKMYHFAVIGPFQKGSALHLMLYVTVIKSSVIFEQWLNVFIRHLALRIM